MGIVQTSDGEYAIRYVYESKRELTPAETITYRVGVTPHLDIRHAGTYVRQGEFLVIISADDFEWVRERLSTQRMKDCHLIYIILHETWHAFQRSHEDMTQLSHNQLDKYADTNAVNVGLITFDEYKTLMWLIANRTASNLKSISSKIMCYMDTITRIMYVRKNSCIHNFMEVNHDLRKEILSHSEEIAKCVRLLSEVN